MRRAWLTSGGTGIAHLSYELGLAVTATGWEDLQKWNAEIRWPQTGSGSEWAKWCGVGV